MEPNQVCGIWQKIPIESTSIRLEYWSIQMFLFVSGSCWHIDCLHFLVYINGNSVWPQSCLNFFCKKTDTLWGWRAGLHYALQRRQSCRHCPVFHIYFVMCYLWNIFWSLCHKALSDSQGTGEKNAIVRCPHGQNAQRHTCPMQPVNFRSRKLFWKNTEISINTFFFL